MVLTNQFISGLRPELQAKVVGMEGSMDALVLKARFEEAKAKELTGSRLSAWKKTPTTTPGESTGGVQATNHRNYICFTHYRHQRRRA